MIIMISVLRNWKMHVEKAAEAAAKRLGYEALKLKQVEVVKAIAQGRMYLLSYRLGLGGASAIHVYHGCLMSCVQRKVRL